MSRANAAHLLFLFIAGTSFTVPPAISSPYSSDAAATFQIHVDTLATDALEGRGLGTRGIRLAERYIADRLAQAGFEAIGDGGSPFQKFAVATAIELDERSAALRLVSPDGERSLELGHDWAPFPIAGSGRFDGPLLFGGYALHAPERGYDDLENADLEGRVVLAFRYEPRENDAASPLDGTRPIPESAIAFKADALADRGAVALILVDGPLAKSADRLPRLTPTGPAAALPIIALSREAADRWLRPQGFDLAAEQAGIDSEMKPATRALPGLRVRGDLRLGRSMTQCRNIVFALPGTGALASEWVVLSAHHDHLGWGGARSMTPGARAIHNGADDNASGVAALLLAAGELEHLLASADSRRGVALVSFSAEEIGLRGSAHYVKHPPHPIEKTVAVINLDMVGRLSEDRLVVLDAGSSPAWGRWLDEVKGSSRLHLVRGGDAYGPSDQASFLKRGIPGVQLFSGAHSEYHSPADDPDLINAAGGALVAELAAALTVRAATAPTRPRIAAIFMPKRIAGDWRSGGASIGTIPDYSAFTGAERGVKISGVREGSPAEKAGLRGGDRIVEIEGIEIGDIGDYAYELRRRSPGDNVPIVVVREGERRALPLTLGSRSERGHTQDRGGSSHEGRTAGHPEDGASLSGGSGSRAHARRHQYAPHTSAPVYHAKEVHLRNIRQLTFGGENAEAYFSPDGESLIYQTTTRAEKEAGGCDRIYIYDIATGRRRAISEGLGRTTCGYFDWPEGKRVIYASTRSGGSECPPVPDHSQGYVWPLYPSYDLYSRNTDGSDDPAPLAAAPGYDAEATWCHQGGRIVFTSTRDGDIELYSMAEDGSELRRLTFEPGYDGGAFFNTDCTKIVFRASRPTGAALHDYRRLLSSDLVRPSHLEIYVMDADGGNPTTLTDDGAASFGPYFHPSGDEVIYSSNRGSEGGREFDLYMVALEGGEPERITFAAGFDGFPMFSPDGRSLIWGSNRNNELRGETNLFLADWVDAPGASKQ
ncbi:MAG: hypothetical protein CME06_06335 [Gemmatimonadetes bacterium]|nr:hypothetical protein [Gemmatimonadota bacterium]